jgi:hypothetical protein
MQIRDKYLSAFSKKEDFVAYMSTWVKEPKEETSLMLDAVQKYELMPSLNYEIDALEDIAAYIYDTDFTKEHKGHSY